MAGAGSGKTPGGEGYCGVIYSPYPQSSPLPLRLAYLIQHFGMDKIHDIMMKRPDGKTFEKRIDRLRQELDAFERARDIFHMVEVDEDDEEEDEDEEDENVGQMLLGDEEKTDVAELPHAPVEGELECKKPKMAQDLRCRL